MAEDFGSININPELVEALKKQNITVPTEVQEKVIPQALENRDVIAQSGTGTGKTLAYLVPLFEKINSTAREMQAMILTPTHELAIQVQRQTELLAKNSGLGVSSAPIIGNVNIDRQVEKLKERPNIIIGSPGRILELIKRRKITAHTIKTIVLDEADRLLDENNLEAVKAVIKSTLKERQLMMFSATIPPETISKGEELMKEPLILKIEEAIAVPTSIEHFYFISEQRDKIEVLRKLVRILNPKKAIVFVNKSEEIEITAAKLLYHGLTAACTYGASFKSERKKAMEDFRSGKIQLLISSDMSSRGLDIEGLTHIFNLSMPENPKDYLHRAGRSGRSGNKGVVISIITERELSLIKMYEKAFKISIGAKDMYMGKITDAGKAPVSKS